MEDVTELEQKLKNLGRKNGGAGAQPFEWHQHQPGRCGT